MPNGWHDGRTGSVELALGLVVVISLGRTPSNRNSGTDAENVSPKLDISAGWEDAEKRVMGRWGRLECMVQQISYSTRTRNMAVDTTRRHGPGGMDGGTVIDSDWYRLCCSDDTRPGYRYPGPAKDMTPSISWGSRTRKIRGLDAGDLDLVGDQDAF